MYRYGANTKKFGHNHNTWGSPQARTKFGQNSDSRVSTKALNKLRKNHHNISPPVAEIAWKKKWNGFFSGAFRIFSGIIFNFSGRFLFFSGRILQFFSRPQFFFLWLFPWFFSRPLWKIIGQNIENFLGLRFFFSRVKKKPCGNAALKRIVFYFLTFFSNPTT